MTTYKTNQQYVQHRGRRFHFVSYEACQANPRTGTVAMPATWFLMSAGKRWPALEVVADQDNDALIANLVSWLDTNVFARPR